MSKKAIEISKHFEGLHDGDLSQIGTQPKMDCAGWWTEGYGKLMIVNGSKLWGEMNREIAYRNITIRDENEAVKDLTQRFAKNEDYVKSKLKVQLSQDKIDALCLHYDNCGYSETLYSLINKGMFEDVRKFWLNKYVSSRGVVLNGLIRRRACEYHLFSTGTIDFEAYRIYQNET